MTNLAEHRDTAKALVTALANRDTDGGVALLRSLDRTALEMTAACLADASNRVVLEHRAEELDLVLTVLAGVADLDPLEGPGEESRTAALDLTKRLIGRVTASITQRRDHLVARAKEA
jgi:hypothetical protein